MLSQVQLGPTRPGSYVLTVRIPVAQSLVRRVGQQLYDAVAAAGEAAATGNRAAFDDMVTAGVSADLCTALSGLAGERGQRPFEIGFRWARGMPSALPAATVTFGERAGELIQSAADRLRRLNTAIEVTATGVVESLHDDPARGDRWRVRVRGEIVTPHGRGSRRTVWVRLTDRRAYDQAIAAHQVQAQVRARGALSNEDRRAELHTGIDGFEVLS